MLSSEYFPLLLFFFRISEKSKRRRKKHSPAEHQPQQQFIEPKLMKNEDAIATHLLNVKRFADSHISPIHFDKFQTSHEDTLEQTRLIPLKPMIKNFELENLFHKHHLPNVDTYQLPTKLYDFNNDTKELDQPAIFNEYIRKNIHQLNSFVCQSISISS